MAIIKTYPLKSNYYGPDRLVLSDMQPDAQGIVHGTTKSLTLSNLKSFIGSGSAVLSLTTTGTSGAATFDANTNTLNIPNYSTYDLTSPSAGVIRLTGSDTTTDDVSVSGSGGITVTQIGTNNVNIDGSSISGGVSQITAGTNITISPSGGTGNVTVTAATPEEPAFSPNPIYTGTAQNASNTLAMFMFKAKATSTMSPTRLIMNFGGATSTDFISVAIYKGIIADASLYASSVNNSMASNGDITFSLTLASGATAINQASNLVVVYSIKGGGTSDTILMNSGYSDIAIAATNTTVGFVDATWAANINTYSATNTTGYSRRLCYMLY